MWFAYVCVCEWRFADDVNVESWFCGALSGFPWFSGEVNLFVLSGQRNQHFWNMFNKTKNSVCFDWLIGGGIVLVS